MADYSTIVIDPLKQIGAGQEFTNRLFDQQASQTAGRAYASGDYAGARTALGGRGDIAGVNAVTAGENAATDRTTAQTAATEARAAAQRDQAMKFISQAAKLLKGVRDQAGPEAMLREYDGLAPVLAQIGTPEQVSQFRQTLASNPGALEAILQASEADVNGVVVNPGGSLRDPRTGAELYTAPFAPRTETVSPGQTLVDVTPGGRSPAGRPPAGDLWSRLIQQESSGDQSAVSPRGAFGRAQLMPDTAAQIAREMGDPSLAQRARTDPAVNERMGQYYLNQQMQRFGNEAVALAAYNAGPEKAAEWVRRFGMPQPGQEAQWAAQIPFPETRQYVTNILGLDGPGDAAGPRVLFQAPPKEEPGYTMLTAEEAQGLGLDPGVRYQRSPTGQITPVGGQARGNLRPIPVAAARGIVENRSRIGQVDRAIASVRSYPDAFGPANYLGGDVVRQYTDPQGVTARAQVADIASMEIKNRSGAAVTISEFPRLRPFIPMQTDSPATVERKLAGLRAELQAMNEEAEAFYSEANGYRPAAPSTAQANAPSRPQLPAGNPRRAPARPRGVPADARQGADGGWYTSDPARPGKYLKWP